MFFSWNIVWQRLKPPGQSNEQDMGVKGFGQFKFLPLSKLILKPDWGLIQGLL